MGFILVVVGIGAEIINVDSKPPLNRSVLTFSLLSPVKIGAHYLKIVDFEHHRAILRYFPWASVV